MMRVFITTMIALAALIIAPFAQAKSFGAKVCKNSSKYVCYKVKKGDSWNKLFPNQQERDVVMRVNRMNTGLYAGKVIAIPASYRKDIMAHAPFSRQIDPPGRKTIIISKSLLAFAAYDSNGEMVRWGPVSTGKGFSTPTGKFSIYSKRGPNCKSSKYPKPRGGAPMPYCMFYYKGYAMHGSPTVPGYNASKGCVRMYTKDAKWIAQEFTPGENVSIVVKN